MSKKLKTIAIWVYAGITLFVIFIPYIVLWLLTFWFDRKHYITQKFTQWWSTFYLYSLPGIKVRVEGKEKLHRNKACIVISNHQSLVDILLLFHTFAYFIWVSKIENFRAPVLGWVMYLNGYISLKREDPKTFPRMFAQIAKALQNNRPVMIFPEGTRSNSSKMGRFKEGAFKAAIENKVPIQPIVLNGSADVFKERPEGQQLWLTVKVLDPIPYENFPTYNPTELKEYFKDIIQNELNQIQEKA